MLNKFYMSLLDEEYDEILDCPEITSSIAAPEDNDEDDDIDFGPQDDEDEEDDDYYDDEDDFDEDIHGSSMFDEILQEEEKSEYLRDYLFAY